MYNIKFIQRYLIIIINYLYPEYKYIKFKNNKIILKKHWYSLKYTEFSIDQLISTIAENKYKKLNYQSKFLLIEKINHERFAQNRHAIETYFYLISPLLINNKTNNDIKQTLINLEKPIISLFK